MKRKHKIDRAVESLAKQNNSISRSVDGIVETTSNQIDTELRSDWEEIQKTTELILLQDLVFGHDCAGDSPRPVKRNRKADQGRKPEKENNI